MPDPGSGNKGQVLALWITGRGQAELRSAPEPRLNAGEVLVRTLWSGISRGTERLVFNGAFRPPNIERMAGPLQEGAFPFPVKYGYCAVGIVEDGPGRPHGPDGVLRCIRTRTALLRPISMLTLVPDGVPPRRAVLAANMETALNALWDAGCGPADRIVVVGGGIIGLLVAHLAARLPGAEVTLVDMQPERRRARRRRWACVSHCPTMRPRRPMWSSTPAPRRPASIWRFLRGVRGGDRGNELVRRPEP